MNFMGLLHGERGADGKSVRCVRGQNCGCEQRKGVRAFALAAMAFKSLTTLKEIFERECSLSCSEQFARRQCGANGEGAHTPPKGGCALPSCATPHLAAFATARWDSAEMGQRATSTDARNSVALLWAAGSTSVGIGQGLEKEFGGEGLRRFPAQGCVRGARGEAARGNALKPFNADLRAETLIGQDEARRGTMAAASPSKCGVEALCWPLSGCLSFSGAYATPGCMRPLTGPLSGSEAARETQRRRIAGKAHASARNPHKATRARRHRFDRRFMADRGSFLAKSRGDIRAPVSLIGLVFLGTGSSAWGCSYSSSINRLARPPPPKISIKSRPRHGPGTLKSPNMKGNGNGDFRNPS